MTKTNRSILVLLCAAGTLLIATGASHSLTTAQTVVLAGQALAGSDTLAYATVTATLVGSGCYTSTDPITSSSKTVTASATGAWTVTLVGTDSLTCLGGWPPTYTIQIKHTVLSRSSVSIEYNGLSIPASNGATTQLRTILASQ